MFNGVLATVTVTNSTISGNSATGLGGGIYDFIGTTNVINSTISGNTSGSSGGGMYSQGGSVQVTNSTITGNTGLGTGGFGNYYAAGTFRNSIVSGNVNSFNGSPSDVGGTPTITVGADNLVGGNALLGPLQNNGGPTETHALLPGSPAIDAGTNAFAVDAGGSPLTTDQRGAGFDRITGGTVDIGAYEVNAPAVTPVDVDVKPGNAKNKVNAKSNGVIPVAILTDGDFDASTVDGSTVQLAGVDADHYALEDVDNDGDLDLILHFRTQDVLAALGLDLDSGDEVDVDATLTGETVDEVMIEGIDTIHFFLKGKKK